MKIEMTTPSGGKSVIEVLPGPQGGAVLNVEREGDSAVIQLPAFTLQRIATALLAALAERQERTDA